MFFRPCTCFTVRKCKVALSWRASVEHSLLSVLNLLVRMQKKACFTNPRPFFLTPLPPLLNPSSWPSSKPTHPPAQPCVTLPPLDRYVLPDTAPLHSPAPFLALSPTPHPIPHRTPSILHCTKIYAMFLQARYAFLDTAPRL